MIDRIEHLKAAPGWFLTATGMGIDLVENHGLTILSTLAILSGIAYHVVLSACAVAKTRHEIRAMERRRRPWPGFGPQLEKFDNRN